MAANLTLRAQKLRAIIRVHKRWDALFAVLGLLAMMVGVLTLAALFAAMVSDGLPRLSGDFFTSFPSRRAGQAGILSALVGSCWLLRRGRSMVYTLVPACIMIATTLTAFAYQLHAALTRVDPVSGVAAPNWFLAGLVTLLIGLAVVVFWEGAKVLRQGRRERLATS